jgi:hypothetical protein
MLGALLRLGFATLIYHLTVYCNTMVIIGGQRQPSRLEGASLDWRTMVVEPSSLVAYICRAELWGAGFVP